MNRLNPYTVRVYVNYLYRIIKEKDDQVNIETVKY